MLAAAIIVAAVLAPTVAAANTKDKVPDSGGQGIEDLPFDENYVEELPPGVTPDMVPYPNRVAKTVGRGTDGHYFGSWYIWHISYTHNYGGTGYTRIHVQPTPWYGRRVGLRWYDSRAWSAAENCMRTGGPHGIYVRSWAAIEDQFLCHALLAPFSWISWDLEGHRYPTNDTKVWIRTRCGW